MPPKRNNIPPAPPVMTLGGAAPVLAAAAVCDLLRAFFNFFWFFGPALAALYCEKKVSEWVGSLWGLTEAVCAATAVKAGAVVSAVTVPFGTVMAMAVALAGYLVIGLWILRTNSRIFKTVTTAPIEFAGALAVGSIPLVGVIPVFSFIIWRLYGAQIKVEKIAFRKWEKENAAALREQRNQQMAYAAQMQAARQAQLMQQEAASDIL